MLHDIRLRLASLSVGTMIHCDCICSRGGWLYRGDDVNEAVEAFRKHCVEIAVLSNPEPSPNQAAPVPKLTPEQSAAVRKAHEILTSFKDTQLYVNWLKDGTEGMYTQEGFERTLKHLLGIVATKYRVVAEYDVYACSPEEAMDIVHHNDATPMNYSVGWDATEKAGMFSAQRGLNATHKHSISIDPTTFK